MEETLDEITSLRQFSQLSLTQGSIPEDTTIMNFRHLLEQHRLAMGILAVINDHLGERGLSLR
ncbi:Mobile element protein [Pseudomonas sp. FeS53a]|jgi:IS5 family transposase|nr:Mobile element protein [Pseudomonas sp. FeS53a]